MNFKNIRKIYISRIIFIFSLIIISIVFNTNVEASNNQNGTKTTTISFEDENLYMAISSEITKKKINIQTGNGTKISNGKEIKIYHIKMKKGTLKNIKELKLDNCNIQNISGLEKFTYLTKLDLSNNKLTDGNDDKGAITSQLTELKQLKELNLSHNYLKYTNGLDKLKNLEKLNLYDNAILNMSGIKELTNLKYLNLGENSIKNKEGDMQEVKCDISTLTNLTYLDFSENYTPGILTQIGELTNLQELYLQSNKITIMNENILENMKKLKVLNLYNNTLTNDENTMKFLNSIQQLTNLESLDLGKTNIMDLSSLVDANKIIVLNNIKKINLSENRYLYTLYTNEQSDRVKNNQEIIKELNDKTYIDKDKTKKIEINYEKLPVKNDEIPHYDSGIAYVTYEDFGARCDGEYDDFIAIRNAHLFANENGYEVRATKGKKYHIFKYYNNAVEVKTNVDWQGAEFIIHDELIDNYLGRYKSIFKVSNIKDQIIIENANGLKINNKRKITKDTTGEDFKISKNTEKILAISEYLKGLNQKGYEKYLCIVENSNERQFIRYGTNANKRRS